MEYTPIITFEGVISSTKMGLFPTQTSLDTLGRTHVPIVKQYNEKNTPNKMAVIQLYFMERQTHSKPCFNLGNILNQSGLKNLGKFK